MLVNGAVIEAVITSPDTTIKAVFIFNFVNM
jgi:uncharacterized protein YlzI (FlbEa/FlbD family)